MVNAPNTTQVQVNGANGDVRNRKGLQAYGTLWQKDASKDTEEDRQQRLSVYDTVVNGYYDGATVIYTMAWGESFHFCRFYRGEPFRQAIARHQHYLASQVEIKPGMRVLDVGCGVGGPAREIARFTGAHIVGVNNNEYQVLQARKRTAKAGLSDQVEFVKGDFMKLAEQFGENSFDAVYAIEATCHAPSFEGVYGEIKKVLKPGGVFGCYEWCMTDRWDPSIPLHKEVAYNIEVGDGIPEMRTIENARNALKTVGYEILVDEDLAERPDPIRWTGPLSGDLRQAQTLFDVMTCWWATRVGKMITQNSLWVAEKIFHLVPPGTWAVGEQLKKAQEGLVPGGEQKLFTPMMLFVARKPASG